MPSGLRENGSKYSHIFRKWNGCCCWCWCCSQGIKLYYNMAFVFPLIGIRQSNNGIIANCWYHSQTHKFPHRPKFSSCYHPDCFFAPKKIYIDKLNFSRKLMRTKLVCIYTEKNMIEFGTRCNCLTGWVSDTLSRCETISTKLTIQNSKFTFRHFPFASFYSGISLKVDEILARVT